MRLLAPIAAVACCLIACSGPDTSNATVPASGTSSSSSSGGAKDSGGCEKKTCESVGGACGAHDDECGGTFSCGTCPPANPCTPLTCDRLGKTCGTHDDGCGTTVNCGPCETGCAKDAKEPNEKFENANDLGEANDYDNTVKTVPTLASSDGDEDWFKIKTTDSGFGGNPLLTATVTDAKLEVSVFHVCNSKPDYSYCGGTGGTQDDTVGKGCRALGTAVLNTDCSGIDESGTTYVRVRKTTTDQACHAYDLTVKIE